MELPPIFLPDELANVMVWMLIKAVQVSIFQSSLFCSSKNCLDALFQVTDSSGVVLTYATVEACSLNLKIEFNKKAFVIDLQSLTAFRSVLKNAILDLQ